MKSIVIVGGGLGSYFSALYLKSLNKDLEITVVDCNPLINYETSGIISPTVLENLNSFGLSIKSVITKAGGKIHLGTKFINWGNKHSDKFFFYETYDHKISEHVDTVLSLNYFCGVKNIGAMLDAPSILAEHKASPFIYNTVLEKKFKFEDNYKVICEYGLSVDPLVLKNMLKEKVIDNNITLIQDQNCKIVPNNELYKIIFTDNSTLSSDLIVNFLSNTLDTFNDNTWERKSDVSGADSYLYFSANLPGDIKPYSEMIATKKCWVYMKHCAGQPIGIAGYNSSLTSVEEIKEHILKEFSAKKEDNKITFFNNKTLNVGYRKNPYVKNLLCLGNAAISSEFNFEKDLDLVKLSLDILLKTEDYNQEINKVYEEVFNFNYFHYLGNDKEFIFWEKIREYKNVPAFVNSIAEEWLVNVPRKDFFTSYLIEPELWIKVANGLDLLNIDLIKEQTSLQISKKEVEIIEEALFSLFSLSDHAVSHSKVLNYVNR
jgi:hypothetical protein